MCYFCNLKHSGHIHKWGVKDVCLHNHKLKVSTQIYHLSTAHDYLMSRIVSYRLGGLPCECGNLGRWHNPSLRHTLPKPACHSQSLSLISPWLIRSLCTGDKRAHAASTDTDLCLFTIQTQGSFLHDWFSVLSLLILHPRTPSDKINTYYKK